MKILIVSTYYNSGGAAIAARRLAEALEKEHSVCFLTQDSTSAPNTFSIASSSFGKWKSQFRLAAEKLSFFFQERSKDVRFRFSHAPIGVDITQLSVFKEADVIHLHWVNQGLLSLKNIEAILKSGKKVVFTLHDMWYFTGGCHYAGDCIGYTKQCGNCPMLKNPSVKDLSYQQLLFKRKIFQENSNYAIVTCSNWLQSMAKQSQVFQQPIYSITNPLPDKLLHQHAQSNRGLFKLPENKTLLLFGAMHIADERKGFFYLKEALNKLSAYRDTVELVLFGSIKEEHKHLLNNLPIPYHLVGSLHPDTELPILYASCDMMVVPSLEDNLPNTIAESMCQGLPVAAFATGGIPQMVDDKVNGCLATTGDAEGLAKAIEFIFTYPDKNELSKKARAKANELYNSNEISKRYTEVYNSIKL